ncbi:VCBS repeat-containing protein [Streptomyces cuspidosporus]|uniref:VCBS repeat-containing protein n=1 Tax=Streptomyces cuspidosporus TaxID=66882 RepID=A0ABN3FXY8_9ACTN
MKADQHDQHDQHDRRDQHDRHDRRDRSGRGPRTPAPSRTAAALACATALALLAACGSGGDGRGSGGGPDGRKAPATSGDHSTSPTPRDAPGSRPATAVTTPTATAPVPRGKGSELPDDINGDGYPELALPLSANEEDAMPSLLAFVHGSSGGLNPATRTVLTGEDLGLPTRGDADAPTLAPATVATADLDGDGYADLVTPVSEPLGEADADRLHTTVRTVPYVTWGRADGPRRGARATRVPLSGPDDSMDGSRPTVGDFNGDGHHDLATIRDDRVSFLVLYGPFGRDGRAARAVPYRTPLDSDNSSGQIDRLFADTIDGDRPTDLVVHAMDDNGQSASVLLTAGPDGLARTGPTLREGNAIAFGDFDGDGLRDVAVGDTGTRNNEPGYETEAPEVDHTLTVYTRKRLEDAPLKETPTIRGIKIPDMEGALAAADTDGDGTDELAVPLASGGVEIITVRPDSPGDIARRRTLSRTVPARVDGEKIPKQRRAARLHGAGDFDHDGKDEIVLAWGRAPGFALSGHRPEWWWIIEGTADRTAFTSEPFATDAR